MTRGHSKHRFVVCIDSGGHDDLQVRRIYQSVPDASAARSHYIRVIDDSGEDYLYPSQLFLSLQVSPRVRVALEGNLVAGA